LRDEPTQRHRRGTRERDRVAEGGADVLHAALRFQLRRPVGHPAPRRSHSVAARRMRREPAMDETKMMEFVNRAVGDVGAVLGGAMVVIGDKLGLYRSMAGAGSLTPTELANRTGTAERYVREWLSAQ